MNEREEKVISLIEKAVKAKEENNINYEYWQKILFDMTDMKKMTQVEAIAIDYILDLNLYR